MARIVASEEVVTLPIAPAYRDYLLKTQVKFLCWVVGVGGAVLMALSALGYGQMKFRDPHTYPHILLLSFARVSVLALYALVIHLLYRRSGVRAYEIGRSSLRLIWWQRDRYWQWMKFASGIYSVTDMEPADWRGLPALRVTLRVSGKSARAIETLLVYSPQDTGVVERQVIPILKEFRREEIGADRLRS